MILYSMISYKQALCAFCTEAVHTENLTAKTPPSEWGNNIYVDLLGHILVDSSEQYKYQYTPLESAMNIITKNFKSSSPWIHYTGCFIVKGETSSITANSQDFLCHRKFHNRKYSTHRLPGNCFKIYLAQTAFLLYKFTENNTYFHINLQIKMHRKYQPIFSFNIAHNLQNQY